MTRHGQSLSEYVLLIGVVAVAAAGMLVYGRRAIQRVVKTAADDLTPIEGDNGREAQILGIRQETGDQRDADGNMKIIPGALLEKESESAVGQGSKIGFSDTLGGGHVTRYQGVSTSTSATSTSKTVNNIR